MHVRMQLFKYRLDAEAKGSTVFRIPEDGHTEWPRAARM